MMPLKFTRLYDKKLIMTQPRISSVNTRITRKLKKLSNNPKLFLIDSSGYKIAQHSWKKSLRLGSFLWVIACFSVAVIYLGLIASDRYVSRAESIIQQAEQMNMLLHALSMLCIGGSNHQVVFPIHAFW